MLILNRFGSWATGYNIPKPQWLSFLRSSSNLLLWNIAIFICHKGYGHSGSSSTISSFRIKLILKELEVMGEGEAWYNKLSLKLYSMRWEELLSKSDQQFYRLILIVGVPIVNYLHYIRFGKIDHSKRYNTEIGFNMSLNSAINFLYRLYRLYIKTWSCPIYSYYWFS